MPVKFLCNECEMEIWQEMNPEDKKTMTIEEAEKICICSTCRLKETGEKKEGEAISFKDTLIVATQNAGLEILWPDDSVDDSLSPLGEIKAFSESRALSTAEVKQARQAAYTQAADALVGKALGLKATLIHIQFNREYGYLAPYCDVNAMAYK